ncbi:Peroxisomal coenzyme A diphosphatase NUDT7 [Aphelenchoides besseyi]|nr:Peroxisomal coenzyme A diphosphatase NUDT7 [Aphelenchoides besseyi]
MSLRLSSSMARVLRKRFDSVLVADSTYATSKPLDRRLKNGEAAILVLLKWENDQWHTFFTVRSTELRLNAGESSFPGGHREIGDRSAIATALRECYEEVGLEEKNVEVVGTFRPLISGHQLLLHAVLALQKDDWTPRLNTTEVQRCYWMPMSVFNSNENYLGPFDVMGILMHRFKYEDEQIAGLTANLAVMISMLLHQRLPPFKLSVQSLSNNLSIEQIAQRQFDETFQLLKLFDKKSKM